VDVAGFKIGRAAAGGGEISPCLDVFASFEDRFSIISYYGAVYELK